MFIAQKHMKEYVIRYVSMKYIQKIGISKKKLFPASILLTSIFVNNNEVRAIPPSSYTIGGYANTTKIVSLLQDVQVLPEEYPSPTLYYASLPDYDLQSLRVDITAIQPLSLSMRTDYITMSGLGKPGNVETTTSVNLDSKEGFQSFKTSIQGDISTTDSTGKLISIKETTITGSSSVAIKLDSNGNNTIMLNYSRTGVETSSTVEFTNPNDTTQKHTVTVYSGSGGNIEVGDGDNVVWIGGAAKEGFSWSGQGTGYDGPSTVYGDIKLGNGSNELKIYNRSEVHGNLILGNGNNSVVLENASIGLIVKDSYTGEFSTVGGLQSHGNITLGTGKNTLHAERVEIAGTVKSGSGEDSLRFVSSSVFGQIQMEGSGQHTLDIEYSTIYDGVSVAGNNNKINIRGGFIGKPKPYNNDTVGEIYKDITIGGTGNTLNLHYLTFGGDIVGSGTIGLHAGAVWKGDRTIKSGQEMFIYSSAQIDGNISFENDSQSLYLYGGEINGDVGSTTSKLGHILIRNEQSDDFVSADVSLLHGDVYAKQLDIAEGTSVHVVPLYVSANDTSNPQHTIRWEDPIQRIFEIDTINLSGDVVLHSGILGDSLSIKGEINPQGGSFILDMNFEEGKYDVLDLSGATMSTTTSGAHRIVYFIPEKPLYYATLGTTLEGVVIGDASLNVALTYEDVGGYEYELVLNPNQKQWDLRLVRISASNYAYAGILENMRNYTRHVWTTINNTFMQNMVSKHGALFSMLPNTSTNKRVFKDVGITAWVNVNYITNTIYDPSAPTIDESALVASAGISTEDIEIDEENDISLHGFASYGITDSELDQYDRNHTMEMNALSVGVVGTWNYKGLGKKHTLFTRIGSWVDMIRNKVNLEGLDYNTRWETYSVKGIASFGYQLQEGSVIFLTSLDSIYSFTRGTSFITRTNNAIDIADDHQISAQLNALVGYSFNFGLTPFFQVIMDIPIYASNDGIIRSNGHPFRYNTENFTTSFNVGLNYTMAFGEDNLRAYCIVGIHKGQPSSTVEVGFMVSGGISYTF